MAKARKTMRHMKRKGKRAIKVGKSARRRTTKHQRRSRRRMKLRGGMTQTQNPVAGGQPPSSALDLQALEEKVEQLEKKINKEVKFTCTANEAS